MEAGVYRLSYFIPVSLHFKKISNAFPSHCVRLLAITRNHYFILKSSNCEKYLLSYYRAEVAQQHGTGSGRYVLPATDRQRKYYHAKNRKALSTLQ